MTRQYGRILGSAAQTLFQLAGQRPDVAPLVGPVGAVLSMMAADVDDHVADRLRQGEQIKALLSEAQQAMPAAGLGEIHAALALTLLTPDDYTLQRIEAYIVTLKQALIRAHAWLETPAGSLHADLLDRVWAFLQADATRASRLVTSIW